MYSGGRRDLEAGAEVCGVVGIIVVVVSDSFSDLSRQPPLTLLTQLEQRETEVRDRQVEETETRQSRLCLCCRRPTELDGLRLSCDSVSGGNWKSAGRVVFLLLVLRADLLLVVAA